METVPTDEDLLPRDTTLSESLADPVFVLVVPRRVDVPVKIVQHHLYDVTYIDTDLYPYLRAARHAGVQSSFSNTPKPSMGISYPVINKQIKRHQFSYTQKPGDSDGDHDSEQTRERDRSDPVTAAHR